MEQRGGWRAGGLGTLVSTYNTVQLMNHQYSAFRGSWIWRSIYPRFRIRPIQYLNCATGLVACLSVTNLRSPLLKNEIGLA